MYKLFLSIALAILLSGNLNAEQPTQESVTKLYVATFDRAPDSDGLKYWVNNSSLELEGISQSFFEQPETKDLYPEGYSNTDFIVAVYENLFNRQPEDSGLRYWRRALSTSTTRSPQDDADLKAGNITRDNFILAVINGAQGDDATILSNKTEVGLAFANSNSNDVSKAKDIMKEITADRGSVDEAIATLSNGGKEKGSTPPDDGKEKGSTPPDDGKEKGSTPPDDGKDKGSTPPDDGKDKDTKSSRETRSFAKSAQLDGAGSIVSPNEKGYGLNKDIAKMHPHGTGGSVVVFQWLYDATTCPRLDISSSEKLWVRIFSKNWSALKIAKTSGMFPLGPSKIFTIDTPNNGNTWTTIAVRSAYPVKNWIDITAKCSTKAVTRALTKPTASQVNVKVDHEDIWTGTGSLISFSNKTGSYGHKKDIVSVDTNGYSTFQWYAQNNCSHLKLSTDGTMSDVYMKIWSEKYWKNMNCNGSSCELTIPFEKLRKYYIVKIKSKNGTDIDASCY